MAIKHLVLAVFVSITCYENSVSQTSEFECRIPDHLFINHSMNVHVELSETQIEGRCFLACAMHMKYSNEIGMRNSSLSYFWPFISIDQTECLIAFEIYECTRGCLRSNRTTSRDLFDCNLKCQQTCRSVTELQNCDQPFECFPWIPSEECQETCKPVNIVNPIHPCLIGCKLNMEILQRQSESAHPLDPIGPLLLIQDNMTAGQFKYYADLSSAVPQPPQCEPISDFTDLPPVTFLFRFVDMNSGNASYRWTADPFEPLDLTDYACQELMVSFAVSNMEGISMFSQSISLMINGDEQLIPIPPNNLTISEKIDEREGFFGHVILHISWDVPQNYSYLDHFVVTATTTAGFNTTICGCEPWIKRVLPNETFHAIEAKSVYSLPVMSCSYEIQIYSIGYFGASYPLRENYDINTKFDARNISFECQFERLSSRKTKEIQSISFNLTWVLPQYLHSENVISKFKVDLNVINVVENITTQIDNITVTFEQESRMIFTKISNFNARNLNMIFLQTLLSEDWFYNLETHVVWNASNIPYTPPNSTLTCAQSTLYPVPGLIEDLNITSCSTNSSHIALFLEWSPPSTINGAELDSYDVCIGLALVPHQGMPDPNNGSYECLTSLNNKLSPAEIKYDHIDSNTPLHVQLQVRAHTVYTTGNWSELHYDLTTCLTHQGVDNLYRVGVIIGSLVLALILCLLLPIGVAIIQRKRKLYQIEQWQDHDPMFSGGIRVFHLKRSPQKLDRWEIPSSEIIVKEPLGEGAFGEVYKGIIKCPIVNPIMMRQSSMKKSIFTPVAIKRLKSSSRGNDRKDFLSEIEMMKKVAEGQNPHVVRLLGCVTIKEPLTIITELVKYGDLLSYLRINRRMCTETDTKEDDENDAYVELGNVSPVDLISFAYQITSGMEYLSSLGIVHRDLACRNILVDEGKVLKITDFGLSRVTDETYYQKSTGRVPLKWMAIESIIAREFTSASDVWSFGVVLWEIGTLGGYPYPSIQNDDLLSRLKGGYRMEKPDNCSPKVYDIMLICWNEQPKRRPTFKELRTKFDTMLLAEKKETYITLCIDESKSYYQNLTHVIADKNLPTRKLASSKVSTVSLDETCTSASRTEESDHTRRPDRLSLQIFTHDQQGQSQPDRYVGTPMKEGLATSPALSQNIQESEGRIEMDSVKRNNPKIEISEY